MFERFTEKGIKAVMLAQEEARFDKHAYVGTEQLLVGLLNLGTGMAFEALDESGVTLALLRDEIRKIVPIGNDSVPVEIPFTPRCKRSLELSWRAATEMRHNYIGTEHLLCGLIKEGEGIGIRALKNLGVNPAVLRNHMLETIASHYVGKATEQPDDLHNLGQAATMLFLLNRFGVSNHFCEKVLQLDGGHFYKDVADAVMAELRKE